MHGAGAQYSPNAVNTDSAEDVEVGDCGGHGEGTEQQSDEHGALDGNALVPHSLLNVIYDALPHRVPPAGTIDPMVQALRAQCNEMTQEFAIGAALVIYSVFLYGERVVVKVFGATGIISQSLPFLFL